MFTFVHLIIMNQKDNEKNNQNDYSKHACNKPDFYFVERFCLKHVRQ